MRDEELGDAGYGVRVMLGVPLDEFNEKSKCVKGNVHLHDAKLSPPPVFHHQSLSTKTTITITNIFLPSHNLRLAECAVVIVCKTRW